MQKKRNISGRGHYALKRNREFEDKPNEDYLIVDNDNLIFILCDGVTRQRVNDDYPQPSLSRKASKLFAETVFNYLKKNRFTNNSITLLQQAAFLGNKEIYNFNKKKLLGVNCHHNDLAGTVSIIGIIKKNFFYYAFIGDCQCLHVTKGKVKKITIPQTIAIKEYRNRQFKKNIDEQKSRRDFRNKIGNPYSYGVFTGEKESLHFVEYGKVALRVDDKIILISDGLINYINRHQLTLIDKTPFQIINKAELFDTKQKFRSDDKSVIIIDIFLSRNTTC